MYIYTGYFILYVHCIHVYTRRWWRDVKANHKNGTLMVYRVLFFSQLIHFCLEFTIFICRYEKCFCFDPDTTAATATDDDDGDDDYWCVFIFHMLVCSISHINMKFLWNRCISTSLFFHLFIYETERVKSCGMKKRIIDISQFGAFERVKWKW